MADNPLIANPMAPMAPLIFGGPDAPDSFTPDSGQVLNADGSVSYDFAGHVHARGMDLDEGGGTAPATDRRMRWIAAAGGVVPEQIWGTKANDGTGDNRYLVMVADDDNGSETLLQLVARGTGATQTGAYATVKRPGNVIVQSKTLIDELGASSFPQLAGAPSSFTMSGFAVATGSFGGSNFIQTFTLNHGLGKVPSGWAICADAVQTAGPIVPVVASVTGVNSAVFNVALFIANGSGASVGTVVRGIAFG